MPPLNTFQKSILAIGISQIVASPVVNAATITVNAITDVGSVEGSCELREAITSFENANVGTTGCNYAGLFGDNDLVDFNSDLLLNQTISLTQSAELSITKELTINGLGKDLLTIDGRSNSGVFGVDIAFNAGYIKSTVTINDLTITGGSAFRGGGINVGSRFSVVSLNDTIVTGNSAASGGGIVMDDSTSLSLSNSVVSGNLATDDAGGIFVIDGSSVNLSNSVVSGNSAADNGGGILTHSASKVSLSNSTLSGNSAADDGGGIYNYRGTISLINSTVSGNLATENGGGITSSGGSVSIINSTVSGSSAVGRGGGLLVRSDGSASLINSTVSGNNAAHGGVTVDGATATLLNTTISDNTASSAGGLLVTDSASIKITNTILANNIGIQGPDCWLFSSTIDASDGGNLVENDGEIFPCGVFSIESQDPLLGPLTNNGGATLTHALLKDSSARNAGTNIFCPATDQRGEKRSDGECDVGAFEFNGSSFFVVPLNDGKTVIFDL